MNYDIPKAREHFAAKQSFTTGPHELVGMTAEAALELLALGYPVAEMEGGFATWEANSYPIATPQPQAA